MKNFDVFISHASEDADWCEQLAGHLENNGLRAFLEKQMSTTVEDDDLVTTIERGLAHSYRVALVLTPKYLIEKQNWDTAGRRFITYQTLAGHREFVIPLFLKDCKIPPFLRPFKRLDFHDPATYQSNLEQLIAMLKDVTLDENTTISSTIPNATSIESRVQERIVTIGGTFDILHKGHKDYIRLAFQFADRVVIYVSSDDYVNGKKDYKARPYDSRVERLKDFIQEIICEPRCEIRCLHKMEDLKKDYLENDCLRHNIYMAVVSPEYYDFFLKLNDTREAQGMKSFLILVKPRTRDHKNGDFSSSIVRYHGSGK